MTLRNYIKSLENILKFNPGIEHYEVIYARDDEGNDFHKVLFNPSIVLTENLEETYLKVNSELNDYKDGNSICIN